MFCCVLFSLLTITQLTHTYPLVLIACQHYIWIITLKKNSLKKKIHRTMSRDSTSENNSGMNS